MDPVKRQVKRVIDRLLNAVISEDLKSLIKNKTFLTGGCFASLQLQETVNDYDFYFKDKESVELFKKIVENKNNAQFTKLEDLYLKISTEFAYTFLLEDNIRIQFITKYYGSPEEVTRKFDFLHTKSYYNLSEDIYKAFIYNYSVNNKQLIFNSKATHPVNALKRLQKFIKKGWTISDQELLKIAEAINNLDMNNYQIYKEQLAGMYGSTYLTAYNIAIYNGNNVAMGNQNSKKRIFKFNE